MSVEVVLIPRFWVAVALVAAALGALLLASIRGGWSLRWFPGSGLWVSGWLPVRGGGGALPFSSFIVFGFYPFRSPLGFRLRCLWSVLLPVFVGAFVPFVVFLWIWSPSARFALSVLGAWIAGLALIIVVDRVAAVLASLWSPLP